MDPFMVERSSFVLVVGALIIGATGGCARSETQAPATQDAQVVAVEQRDVPVVYEWVGTLDGFVNAQVRAQVSGYLVKQDYKEGAAVSQGDLLFEIDPRPFAAALAQAEGVFAQAQAQLGKTELDVAALHAPRPGQGHQPGGAGRRRPGAPGRPGPGRVRPGRGRPGPAQSGIHAHRGAGGRHCRAHQGTDRRPGRPDHRRPDDRLQGGSHQGVLSDKRAGLPRLQGARARRAGHPRRHQFDSSFPTAPRTPARANSYAIDNQVDGTPAP